MSNAIVVLNAGSSSIKFSLFVERGETLELDVRGQVEGLYTTARFVSKAPDGTLRAEKSWPDGVEPGHDGALDHPQPKVAILSAVETVNPKIPATIDAAALCKSAGLVPGAPVPIILTSRADSVEARLASCAVVVAFAYWLRGGQHIKQSTQT
jgi:hypothetical protein